MSHALLSEWKTNSAVLRAVGGVSGIGFDTLCRVEEVSSDRLLLVWDEGDSSITLIGANFEYHEISEASPERRVPEEAEWTRQLIIRWPSQPEKLCILFKQREAS